MGAGDERARVDVGVGEVEGAGVDVGMGAGVGPGPGPDAMPGVCARAPPARGTQGVGRAAGKYIHEVIDAEVYPPRLGQPTGRSPCRGRSPKQR